MRRFFKNQDGGIAIIFALSLPVIGGTVAAATVTSEVVGARTSTTNALDAAVLAATSLGYTATDAERTVRAEEVFRTNLANRAKIAATAKFSVSRTGNVSQGNILVTGVANFDYRSPFHAWTAVLSTSVSVTAAATKMRSDPICVLATATQSPRALEVYGTALFNVANCAVQTNSQSGEAMKIYGNARASARQFGVTGRYSGEAWSPSPFTGIEPVTDPYSTLPVPAPGSCMTGVDQKLTQAAVTLQPGTYCGGLTIKADSRVTLERGVYIMKDGAFRVDSNAVVEGKEVLIVLLGADSIIYLNSGASVILTSPRGGTYINMQFMSDRRLDKSKFQQEWSTILGGATLSYDGVIYLPEQQFWVSGTASKAVVIGRSPTMILVANTIWAQGNAQFDLRQENLRGLNLPDPARFSYAARLVQ